MALEKQIKKATKDENLIKKQMRQVEDRERDERRQMELIKEKQNLIVPKNIRNTIRSRKPDLNIKKDDTV